MVLAVLLLHGLGLWWSQGVWQPRSQIKLMEEPIYARLIQAREPAALPRPRAGQAPVPAQPRAAVSNTNAIATRPVPKPEPAAAAPEAAAKPIPKPEAKPAADKPAVRIPEPPQTDRPLFAALAPQDDIAPLPEPLEPAALAPSPEPSPTPSPTVPAEPEPSTSPSLLAGESRPELASPESAASAVVTGDAAGQQANGGQNSPGTADIYQDWPQDTRINVKISGYFRGKVTGSGSVTWQRAQDQSQYQARVAVSFGIAGFTMTSQGSVTDAGLNPRIFEESLAGRLRSAHFEDEAITIGSGKRIPRAGLPGGVGAGTFQDSASQFVELSWRFATGRAVLAPGSTVTYWLGRPEGLYQYIYDISGPEPLSLPKLGTVNAWHLTPRPIPGLKKDAIYGEIWIAPSLQYLPAKIRMRNAEGVYLDLLVDSIEQADQKP